MCSSKDVALSLSGLKAMPKEEESVLKSKGGPFADLSSWSDFLNGISLAYPMRHPRNSDGKDKIRAKLAETKDSIHMKSTTIAEPLNIYSQAVAAQMKAPKIDPDA